MNSVEEAFERFPGSLRQAMRDAYNDGCGVMADELLQRGEMRPEVALMAGMAIDPVGRNRFEEALQNYAFPQGVLPNEADEVIVGGGAHAAVYAAVRNSQGFGRPLVLERNARFGGTLAMTKQPSFFLNSRNRPGPLGSPGTRDALNVIPGAPMQPSDIGGFEYQTNADLGLVIRCTLALNAEVRQATVTGIEQQGNRQIVQTDRGPVVVKRVIVATGLGEEKTMFQNNGAVVGALPDGRRVMTYSQFMRRFDGMFPLRDLGRVAVIGGGDSGKTVIEALTGYGPNTMGSVASLDYIEKIDWYGAREFSCGDWTDRSRTRYKRIGGLLPSPSRPFSRVTPKQKAEAFGQMFDGVTINGSTYDTVVIAVGYERRPIPGEVAYATGWLRDQSNTIRLAQVNDDRSFVQIGALCAPEFADADNDAAKQIPENQVALFRLAPRTATAASLLSPA